LRALGQYLLEVRTLVQRVQKHKVVLLACTEQRLHTVLGDFEALEFGEEPLRIRLRLYPAVMLRNFLAEAGLVTNQLLD
jgi:hypothetical protein